MPRRRTRYWPNSGETVIDKVSVHYPGDWDVQLKRPYDQFTQKSSVEDEPGLHGDRFLVDMYEVNPPVYPAMGPGPSDGSFKWRLRNLPIADPLLGVWTGHLDDPQLPDINTLAVTCLKRTNPSKPWIDLPVAALELRELPDLVKNSGNSFLERAAKRNLQTEFGFAPLYSDLLKLNKFRKKVENRVALLKKLREGPVLRKVELYKGSVSDYKGQGYFNSEYGPSIGTITFGCRNRLTRVRAWGYVTYSPDADWDVKLPPTDYAYEMRARKIIGGATIDLSTAWNAYPWTWLADWFGNIGDYLEAHRNVVPVTHDKPRVMIRTETTTVIAISAPRYGIPHESARETITGRHVTKYRTPASASLPSFDMPFLSQRQVNILASLAVVKKDSLRSFF